MEVLTLDYGGIVVAVLMGIALLVLGGAMGYFFLAVMLLFLFFSAAVTYIGRDYKKRSGIGQKPRGIYNVLANGVVPLAMIVIYSFSLAAGMQRFAALSVIGFVASAAAITADKFGSEIGVLDGEPWSIIGRRRVKKGTSGAVSWLGLVASVIGALLVAVSLVWISGVAFGIQYLIFVATISGFVGGLVDSVIGYYEEEGIGNKYTSNVLCSLAGALVAVAILVIL